MTHRPFMIAIAACLLGIATVGSAQETAIQVSEWNALGPMGSAALKGYPQDYPSIPRDEREYRGWLHWYRVFLHNLKDYPMNPEGGGIVDLNATYKGDITINGAGQELEVSWKKISIPNPSARYPRRPQLHNGTGMSFFSTWIYSPKPAFAKFFFNGYRGEEKKGNGISCWVNGAYLPTRWMRKDIPMIQQPVSGTQATLKEGWNHVYVRHISAWAGTCNSLQIRVPQDVASELRVSADPPEEIGRTFKFNGQPASGETAVAKPAAPTPKPVAKPAPKPAPKTTAPVEESSDSGVPTIRIF